MAFLNLCKLGVNKMANRIVLVTGSSRGIGFGIAKAFAENGDIVVLNGKTDANQLKSAVY